MIDNNYFGGRPRPIKEDWMNFDQIVQYIRDTNYDDYGNRRNTFDPVELDGVLAHKDEDGYDVTLVWHFPKFDVYVQCKEFDGSYSSGVSYEGFTQVFPHEKTVTFYTEER